MKEKLMCALQVIKRFLWGTYCGFRLCVYLFVVMVALDLVELTREIAHNVMSFVITFSMLYAILSQWLAVFMPRMNRVKMVAIVYSLYMLLVVFCVNNDALNEDYLRSRLSGSEIMYCGIIAPVFTILLTIIERFFADKLQGWWRRIVKWLYNGIAILPLLAVAALFMWLWYTDYHRKHRFADNDAIERITGVAFPELEIIDYKKGETGFMGDYNDELTLEMEEELSESTYHYLDSIISFGNTKWSKYDDGYYRFSTIWGGSIPAPDGVSGENK